MARVPYVRAEGTQASPEVRSLYEGIAGLRGNVLNLYRALANQPPALRAFMAMSRYVRDDSSLAPDVRELAIVATGHALGVPYELFHHEPLARRAGATDEQLAALREGRDSESFTAAQRIATTYAREVARNRNASEDLIASARAVLGESGLIDLAITVAWYHFCAALIGPLEIEVEA